MDALPRRYETDDDYRYARPVLVVWEITLACNLKCVHCGSRAGKKRANELSYSECLDVIKQLAQVGVRHVALIGGEAYLRRDWLDIIRAVRDHGMDCSIQTGGYALTPEKIKLAAQAGLVSCGVSIDGLSETHDRLRGRVGSYKQAMEVLRCLNEYQIASSVNTQITRVNIPELREMMRVLIAVGVRNWQIQLTVAMGNAADRPEILVQPYELLDLMPLLAELHQEALQRNLLIQPGNNIGYFGPYEYYWRIVDDAKGHWQGCAAGHTGLGIEADGTIKGCPSLPTTAYTAGNIRDMSIEQMLKASQQLRFTRDRTIEDLWGYCKSCYYADVCRAGCTWTSHVLFGRAGNNPYCHYRALDLAKQGLRERIVKVGVAPGRPFDYGQFDLVTESLDGSDGRRSVAHPPPAKSPARLVSIESRIPPVMQLCYGCRQYVHQGTVLCPHCGSDVSSRQADHDQDLTAARSATAHLERIVERNRDLVTSDSAPRERPS